MISYQSSLIFLLSSSLWGSLRAEKRSPNSNWKSVFFTLFAVGCYHGGVESVCILIENIILLFASLEVEQCIFLSYESFKIAPNLLSIKWSNMVFDSNCKSLFFSYFMIVLAGLLTGMSWNSLAQYHRDVNLPDVKHLTHVHIKGFLRG